MGVGLIASQEKCASFGWICTPSTCWWKQSAWIRAYRRKQHNCSLSRIDSVCQAHVFREGRGRHRCAGTVADDWCPHCASGVKNTRHPRDFLFFFWLFFLPSFPLPAEGKEKAAGGGGGWVELKYHITVHLPSTAAQWNMQRTWAAGATWRVRCYQLGRIRPRRTAIITTREILIWTVRMKAKDRWAGSLSQVDFLMQPRYSQKRHPPKKDPRSHLDSALYSPQSSESPQGVFQKKAHSGCFNQNAWFHLWWGNKCLLLVLNSDLISLFTCTRDVIKRNKNARWNHTEK